jgi:ATP-binding cassette subfamily B (MDR/TAP) protein 1
MFTEQATRTNPATPLSGLVCVPAPTLPIPHTTSITTLFYVLSFSPPFPSPIRQPRAAICHPISLYAIGILAALSAGACVPAGGIVYGWWTTGVTDVHSSESSKSQRSRDAGWVMAVVGVATLVLCWLFTVCCEWV